MSLCPIGLPKTTTKETRSTIKTTFTLLVLSFTTYWLQSILILSFLKKKGKKCSTRSAFLIDGFSILKVWANMDKIVFSHSLGCLSESVSILIPSADLNFSGFLLFSDNIYNFFGEYTFYMDWLFILLFKSSLILN